MLRLMKPAPSRVGKLVGDEIIRYRSAQRVCQSNQIAELMTCLNPIQGFLSYSHHDRLAARCIKDALGPYGIMTFLAHQDIRPSQEWQDEISRALHACEVFFLLLTESFKHSDWTDQETGIAVALNKIIVPLKISLNPYGFVARYQAQHLSGTQLRGPNDLKVNEGCWTVVRTLAQRAHLGVRIRDHVIGSFAQSSSFREAGQYASKLQDLEPFNPGQVKEIVEVGCRNNQIYGSFTAIQYVRGLIRKNRASVPKVLSSQFRQMTGNRVIASNFSASSNANQCPESEWKFG